MYAIPLDSARQDASPHGHTHGSTGGSTGSGSGSGGSGSTAASGSNGSASSGSTSASSAGGGSGGTSGSAGGSGSHSGSGGKSGAGGEPLLVPGGQPGSLIHSSNGFGSSPTVPGLHNTADAGLASVQSDSSNAPLIAILLAVVVMAIGAFAGGRAWHISRQPPARPS